MTFLFPFLVWKMTALRCCWVHFVGLNAPSEGPYAWFNKGQSKMPERIEWHRDDRDGFRFHRRSFNTSDPAKWNVWFALVHLYHLVTSFPNRGVYWETCSFEYVSTFALWWHSRCVLPKLFYNRWCGHLSICNERTIWGHDHPSHPPLEGARGEHWNQLVSWEWTVRHCWVDDFLVPGGNGRWLELVKATASTSWTCRAAASCIFRRIAMLTLTSVEPIRLGICQNL